MKTGIGKDEGLGSGKGNYNLLCLYLLLLFTSICFSPAIYAAAGQSGGYFLRMIQSPRASAMGEGGAGLYGDLLGAMALNPAALGRIRYSEFALTYNAWLEDISLQQFAYAQPLPDKSALAASLSLLQMKAFPGYDNSGGYAGSVDAGDSAVTLAYARRIYGRWDVLRFGLFIGSGVKYAREVLEKSSAGALLYDGGLLSVSRFAGGVLGLGVSAQSLGEGSSSTPSRQGSVILRADRG